MLLFFVGVLPVVSESWFAGVVLVPWMALFAVIIPGPLRARVLASQFAGSGQSYCMHFVLLCPSPGGCVPVL